VLVFFKTIFLVIVFGVFHALVWLPIVLSTTTPLLEKVGQQLGFAVAEKDTAKKANDQTKSVLKKPANGTT
jgi:hypothetical protein